MRTNVLKPSTLVLLTVAACSEPRPSAAPPPSRLGTVTPEVRALFTEQCGPRGVVLVRPWSMPVNPDIMAEELACQTDEPLRPAASMSLVYEVQTGDLIAALSSSASEAFAKAYIERVLGRALAPVHAARLLVLREQAARAIPPTGYPQTTNFFLNEPRDILLTISFDDRHGDVPFWSVTLNRFLPPTPPAGKEGAR